METIFKSVCFILLLATGYLPALSQTSETSSGKYYIFTHYTTQNGLLSNDIFSMAQDKNGYLWIASSVGLNRFDGKSFYYRAIPEIYNNSALLPHIGNTWDGEVIIASYLQGVFVQQEDGQFKQYLDGGAVEIGKNMFKGVKSNSDGAIFAYTARSLYLIEDGLMNQVYDYGSAMNVFSTLEIDKENRIWFGGRLGVGVMLPTDRGYEPVLLPEFKDKLIVHILFDEEGTLHVATIQGYYRITWSQPFQWDSNYTLEQPFPQLKEIYINRLYIDNTGNLWIPTDSYGVFRTKGDEVTLHLTYENGLISSSVTNVLQDHEGNYWFGTINGLSMVRDFDNFAIAHNGALFKDASTLMADEYQRIWIQSRSALYLYQDDALIPLSLSGTPLEIAGVRLFEINNSEVLISNDVGLYTLPISKSVPDMRKVEKVADYATHKMGGLLHSLTSDEEGVWICAATKLCNYYNHKFLSVKFNHADSINLSPRRMVRDKYGFYWCADYSNGLYRGLITRPDVNKIQYDIESVYKSIKADSTFVTASIRDMTFDKEGNLWFSSLYTGVYKLVIDSVGVVSHTLYSTAEGLISNNVYGITFDDEGRVWFLTPRGISILSRNSSGVESIEKFDVRTVGEGISESPLQMGNRLYILTDEGVFITQNQFYKEKIEKVPHVVITHLLINGVADSKISASTSDIRLSHQQNNIIIEFSAITFRSADDVRYQYTLEGADNDWSVLSERGFVEYAALRPGKYSFKVRAAMDSALGEVGEETSLGFRILPPYYQAIWFYVLITIGVASLLFTLHKNRMNQVIKMERMRTRIASDLHDDIGSTLSSISLISEMARPQDRESELAKALGKIGTDSRDVLNSMDDIIWSVKPQNDSLSSLVVRLREYAIPLCESKNIVFQMDIDEDPLSLKLSMEERRNIFLIVKEAVNNAVKHSGCQTLSVTFVQKNELEITIQDDGCGFDTDSPTSRNGLANIKHRAAQIGCAWVVSSQKGIGTTIRLKAKII